MVNDPESADELEVPTNPSGGKGQPRAARGPRSRPSGPARDLRSARLGIKRLLRDRQAGRISSKEFERRMGAYRQLVRLATRALTEQREQKKLTVIPVTLPAWAQETNRE